MLYQDHAGNLSIMASGKMTPIVEVLENAGHSEDSCRFAFPAVVSLYDDLPHAVGVVGVLNTSGSWNKVEFVFVDGALFKIMNVSVDEIADMTVVQIGDDELTAEQVVVALDTPLLLD